MMANVSIQWASGHLWVEVTASRVAPRELKDAVGAGCVASHVQVGHVWFQHLSLEKGCLEGLFRDLGTTPMLSLPT